MDNSKKQELIEKYKLSTQELDRIGNPIADLAAARLTSQNEPRLIFTGGQAGAGKSSISDLQVDRFQKDIAIVDTNDDIFKVLNLEKPSNQGKIVTDCMDLENTKSKSNR